MPPKIIEIIIIAEPNATCETDFFSIENVAAADITAILKRINNVLFDAPINLKKAVAIKQNAVILMDSRIKLL